MDLDFESLKTKQRSLRDGFAENLALRVHRALSWLQKSEDCKDDQDSRFIFLWIAFNAAYAQDTEVLRHTESEAFSLFVSKLVELDKRNKLYNLVWTEFSSSVRVLLDNQYVYQPFWDYHNGKLTEQEWRERFAKSKDGSEFCFVFKTNRSSYSYYSPTFIYVKKPINTRWCNLAKFSKPCTN